MAMELRHGTVRHVTMRAEVAAGRGWCSVAYFSLDGQPAVLVCEKLAPYSRTPLPAPFAAGALGGFSALAKLLLSQEN